MKYCIWNIIFDICHEFIKSVFCYIISPVGKPNNNICSQYLQHWIYSYSRICSCRDRFYSTTDILRKSWSSVIICYRVIPRKPVHNRSRHSLNIWNNSFWQSWWFLTLMMMHIVQLSARSFYPYVQLRNSFRPPRWYHSKTRSQPYFHKEIWSLGLQNSQKHWGCTILADLGWKFLDKKFNSINRKTFVR